MMNESKSMFRRAWITAGSKDLWNCRTTYCTIPHENLPALAAATDDLNWLTAISPDLRRRPTSLNDDVKQIANLDDIVEKARNLKLSLPEPFLRFMRDGRMQEKVPTCTDCFLELSGDFIPLFETRGQYLLRFLNDSQSCVMWYLYLNQEGSTGVVASPCFFEPELFEAMQYEDVKREDLIHEANLCADTFTEFLYRFWIENSIWYSLYERLPLTPVQEQYRNQITKKLA